MQTYQFVDDQLESNVTYYRLKQVDFDGKFQYSKVVTVVNAQKSGIAVYPNPASTKLVLQTEKDEIGSVRIYQINGQLVYAQKIPVSMANIDVSSFVNGIYVVETITDTGTHLSRFVKN